MKQIKKLSIVLFLLITFFSCSVIFDNPVDPDSENYNGYDTVDDINKVKSIDTSGDYEEAPDLIVSKLNNVLKYEWEISDSYKYFDNAYNETNLENKFNPENFNLSNGTWYWRARAIDSDGNIGNWTEVQSFTIYGNYVQSYRFNYDSNRAEGGSVPDIQYYTEGTKIEVVNVGDLNKTGYRFKCWNTASNGSGTDYYPGDYFIMGDRSVTLFAVWVEADIIDPSKDGLILEFLFNENITDTSGNNLTGALYGANLSHVLTRDRFGNDNSAVKFDGINDYISVSSDLLKNKTFTISIWEKSDNIGGSLLNYTNNLSYYGYSLVIDDDVITGQLRSGNGNSNSYVEKSIISTENWNHIVFSKGDDNILRLYFNGENIAISNASGIVWDTSMLLYIGADSPTYIPNSSWYNGSIDDLRIYNRALDDNEISDLYSEKENSTPTTFKLIFNKNSDEATGSMDNQIIDVLSTEAISKNTFTRPGYNFLGWRTTPGGDVEYSDEAQYTMGYGDVTLYAVWELKSYTVTFDKNNTEATGSMGDQVFNHGHSSVLTSNNYKLEGHNFKGWSSTKTGEVEYTDSQVYAIGTENVVLYAVWEESSYTITFSKNADDALGAMGNIKATYTSSIRLPSYGFKRPWYNFLGWSTTQNGIVEYDDEDYLYSKTVTSDLTLYAIWEEKPRIPRDGLVGEWLFDGTILDTSGNNNHGVGYSAMYVDDNNGKKDSALYLNGVNNYVDIPVSGLRSYSISFWIKKEIDGYFFKGLNEENSPKIGIHLEDITVDVSNTDTIPGSFSYKEEMRVFIITVDVDRYERLIENSHGSTYYKNYDTPLYDTDYRIGGDLFKGKIDNLRIYNRILTYEEKRAIKNEYEEYK